MLCSPPHGCSANKQNQSLIPLLFPVPLAHKGSLDSLSGTIPNPPIHIFKLGAHIYLVAAPRSINSLIKASLSTSVSSFLPNRFMRFVYRFLVRPARKTLRPQRQIK
ncbi:hypothetical protein PGT21_030540 [Puccinia graminis f. sp. tritici]|uniref:Uncharacterized protein n=1 Tax=Puccinia graminis f. sp. tritici TaxID=56615 RepID=A0A5B0QJ85_PUCGR|nr:hypothetical protein PGTUg99_027964 [Puccinia graminis f. sp. tritici]KAA1113391.1 hypothetical protein PGT21_030540 [Puccinia graminis f. sp. tritici]